MVAIGNHFAERDQELITIKRGDSVLAMAHDGHVRGMSKMERLIGQKAMEIVENTGKRVYFFIEG